MENKRVKRKDNTCCCVPQCNSAGYKDLNISFHKFPKVDSTCRRTTADGRIVIVNRRIEWKRILRVGREVSNRMSVCSKHFAPDAFTFPPERCKRPRLKIFALPSLCLPKTPSSPEENINLKTKKRNKKKNRFSQNLESRKCSTAAQHKNRRPPHASVLNSNHQKENKLDLHSVCEAKIDDDEESYIYPLFFSHQQKKTECRTSSQEQISPIRIENYTPVKMPSAIFSNEESNMKIDLTMTTNPFDSGQLVSSLSSPLSENALRQWLENSEITIKNYQEEIHLLQQSNCRMKEKISAFHILFDNLQKQKLIEKYLLDVIKQFLMIYETSSQNLELRKCSTAAVKGAKFQPAHASILNLNYPKEDKLDQHSVCETKIDDNEESYILPLVISHQQKEIECRTSSQEQISPTKTENSTQEEISPANFSNEGSNMEKDLTATINTSNYEQLVSLVSSPLSENSALKERLENAEITIKNCREQIHVLQQSNCRMKKTISAFHALFDNLQKQKLIEKSILDVIKQFLMIHET